ncbi:TIGR01212 family radical SAM protein [Pseudobdellovibrio exovorus]|uniref:Putative Fe-S oxidoreductase n=1 Tax=Pseudobdellovibrio exovorus JSS TaxID=1184267 RepID=M4V8M2_9BACT|nr:TIGR01212 family radical SAM protein [Pseudobdellovibrio exovorus]AGH95548.1 putative Fe-S oxidoreductase [Pseudobdellovibrio exovorus JSS]
MEKGWSGLPYHSISEHFRRIFNEKVYKIPVSVVDDCPNRMGLKGMKTCSFCDVWGSAAREESFQMSLDQQIEKYHDLISKKYKANKYLVYFQAYTNTFTKIPALRHNFETALKYPYVSGFVLGTRPDCLSEAVLQLWQEYCQKSFVAVELGVQSFFNPHLEFMRRGHTAQDSLKAITKISEKTSVDLGIHLIFGSPNETDAEIIETARICNDLPITNVKLHNMHVLKNTALEEWYNEGNFIPLELDEYQRKVQLFLSYLHPRIAVHRLAAYASRWDELVAPQWTRDKMGPHQAIVDFLRQEKTYQGCKLVAQNDVDRILFHQMSLRVERTIST